MTRPVRRDRHGRGLRGPLLPPQAPGWRTRAAWFDDVVRRAAQDLMGRWSEQLAEVQFVVEEVPPDLTGTQDGLVADETAGGPVPLGRLVRAEGARPARLTVYRRPLEARAEGPVDLADLVHEVLVELVSDLLGLDPDEVDPP